MAFGWAGAGGGAADALQNIVKQRLEQSMLEERIRAAKAQEELQRQQNEETRLFRQAQVDRWGKDDARQAAQDALAAQERARTQAAELSDRQLSPTELVRASAEGRMGAVAMPKAKLITSPSVSAEQAAAYNEKVDQSPIGDFGAHTGSMGTLKTVRDIIQKEKDTADTRTYEGKKEADRRDFELRRDAQNNAQAESRLQRQLDAETAREAAKAGVKAGETKKEEDTKRTAVKNSAQQTLDVINEILDEKGGLRPEIAGAVGKSRMFGGQFIPGTETRNADATINRLKGRLIVDLLGELKSQSKTGATGFGALSEKELAILEAAASKIDPSLGEAAFTQEVRRVRDMVKRVVQDKEDTSNDPLGIR